MKCYMVFIFNRLGGYSKQLHFIDYTLKEVKAKIKKDYPAPKWELERIVRG